MSPAARTRRSNGRKKKQSRTGWLRWLPLVLGLAVTPFAVRAASVLALTGPSAFRTLYPWVALIQSHAQSFSFDQVETLSQWVMYGQFPAYGLLWVVASWVIGRNAGPLFALGLHCVGLAAAILSGNH